MTKIIITAQSKDIGQYNRDMSALSQAFRPIADKLGGETGIGNGNEPGKPAFLVFFNDAAAATAFATQAQELASKKTFLVFRTLPKMNLKQE